jgi:ferredoxin/flavodoxin---NADP+ reductase
MRRCTFCSTGKRGRISQDRGGYGSHSNSVLVCRVANVQYLPSWSAETQPAMKYTKEQVTYVHHWTDRLFSLRTTRSSGFRFSNGQFTMMGLEVDGRPLLRAYSMVSTNYDEYLEFFSIRVPDGALTSRLGHIKPGDEVLVGTKPTGTLTIGNLLPGKTLWMLATGTGLAAFLGTVRDPETYERFERVILVHSCREIKDLAYRDLLTKELPQDELLGEMVSAQFSYVPAITREPFETEGRITHLMQTGKLYERCGRGPLDVNEDRVMLCGNTDMLEETMKMLEDAGFSHGNSGEPGHYLTERAFAQK